MIIHKLDETRLVHGRAVDILSEHVDALLRFHDLRLHRGDPRRAAAGWVRQWGIGATRAFVWLIDQSSGFSTHTELGASFWPIANSPNDASRSFFKRLRERRLQCVDSAGELRPLAPIRWGRDAFFSPHGIAVSLCRRGISAPMRDQVMATAALAQAATANLRGAIEHVLDDVSASDEKKELARSILKSWGHESKPKPVQETLFAKAPGAS